MGAPNPFFDKDVPADTLKSSILKKGFIGGSGLFADDGFLAAVTLTFAATIL